MTYTYAILEVSKATFDELVDAKYDHAFNDDDDGALVIDMHGIALKEKK